MNRLIIRRDFATELKISINYTGRVDVDIWNRYTENDEWESKRNVYIELEREKIDNDKTIFEFIATDQWEFPVKVEIV